MSFKIVANRFGNYVRAAAAALCGGTVQRLQNRLVEIDRWYCVSLKSGGPILG
ncbi:MAG TPA: hypothetical protein VK200_04550 [Candidatus Limnocylindrales bacterium]|nr:hypothetical protein [Candidatus Limnocylindrales bacterium]